VAGTVMIQDTNAAALAESPRDLVNVNGTLFFTAIEFMPHGGQTELWKSDGTAAGTVMVKRLNATELVNVNGTLFFASDNIHGLELWKSDGTAEGTVLVKDINPNGFAGSNPHNLVAFKGALFFAADDGSGIGLWTSDGTEAGTKQLAAGAAYDPTSLLTVQDRTLFFAAQTPTIDGAKGRELWQTDGTEEGTFLVQDINPGPNSSNPTNLCNVGNTLFFAADDGVHGVELWRNGPLPGVDLRGGALLAPQAPVFLGVQKQGAMDMSGGQFQAGTLTLGSGPGSGGTLNLSAGSVVVNRDLTLGAASGSSGALSASGGTLDVSAGTIAVGPVGYGTLNLSGTASATAQQVKLGGSTVGASGILTLSQNASLTIIGNSRAAGLSSNDAEQEGGTLDASQTSIVIGENHNAQYNLSGGKAIASEVYVGYTPGFTGWFNQGGGSLIVTTNLVVGDFSGGDCSSNAIGLARMTDGTCYVTNASSTAILEVRNGTFTLSGGTLVVDQLIVTNPCARFIHTGGTLLQNHPPILDPNGDADGDGYSNAAEIAAGTDPLNPYSLTLPSLTISLDSQLSIINIAWPSAPTGFVLQQNGNVNDPNGWSEFAGTVSDNGVTKSVSVPLSTRNTFYRLKK
jgi:ELWxxDGT repeat protein